MREPTIEGPRPCSARDLPGVIAVVDAAMREGSGQTMLTDYPLVYADRNLANIRVITADGEVVSVVPFVPRDVVLGDCAFRIGIISPTATAPAHRRRGFGLRCLESVIDGMRAAGCALSVLWTQVETFPFYEHAGFQAVRHQATRYPCRREDAARFSDGGEASVELDPGNAELLEAIRALHERESDGVRRAPHEYPMLFALPRMRTHVALRDGRAAAYLVSSRAVNKPGLIEGGGDEDALETLVGRALGALGAGESVDAHTHLSDTVLERVLRRRMPERRATVAAGMMIRVDAPREFLARVRPALAAANPGFARAVSVTITDAGEAFALRCSPSGLAVGAERQAPRLELSRREWTSVLFGAHPERPGPPVGALGGMTPLYFPIGVLDRS